MLLLKPTATDLNNIEMDAWQASSTRPYSLGSAWYIYVVGLNVNDKGYNRYN